MGPLEAAIVELLIQSAEANLREGIEITEADKTEMKRLMDEAREMDKAMSHEK